MHDWQHFIHSFIHSCICYGGGGKGGSKFNSFCYFTILYNILLVNIVNKNQTESGPKETLSAHATDEDSLHSSNDTSEDLYNSLHCSTSVEEWVNVTISTNVEDEQHQQVEQHGQDETMNCAEKTSAFDEQFY